MVEEEEEYYCEGIIPGQPKETDYMKEYMLSTISSIKEDLIMKFPQETSEFYVYTKYTEKEDNRTFKVFVTLQKETSINYREMNINFLIIINEEFPNKPPMVFCFTDVNHIKHIILIIIIFFYYNIVR